MFSFKNSCKISLKILLVLSIEVGLSYENTSKYYKCGVNHRFKGLSVGGSKILQNEWPWLASLFYKSSNEYFCSGTIISKHRVLTAAHCVHNKGQTSPLAANDVYAYLGKHDLAKLSETGSEKFFPREIKIHPDWTSEGPKYDADLALLISTRRIIYTMQITPVCLWPSTTGQNNSGLGTVVGWGASEQTNRRDHEIIARKVEVKRVPLITCLLTDHLIGKPASNRTFCGIGSETNTGPCTGDSGGGFFVEVNNVWFIQGIVSSAFILSDHTCDVSRHSVYTKITDFLSWIKPPQCVYSGESDCESSITTMTPAPPIDEAPALYNPYQYLPSHFVNQIYGVK